MNAQVWQSWGLRGCTVAVVGCPDHAIGTIAALVEAEAKVVVVASHLPHAIGELVHRGDVTQVNTLAETPEVSLLLLADPTLSDDATAWASAHGTPHAAIPAPEESNAHVPTHLRGTVTLVGGGPGAADLVPLRAWRALEQCDVVLADRLAPLDLLPSLPHPPQVIDVSKIPRGAFTPQDEINRLLIHHAKAGHHVVRFKGGDSFVFGRGMEEIEACLDADVPVRVIPGISSSIAGPELAGIPVTHRGLVQGFTVVSGHVAPTDPRSTVDWAALAHSRLTLVIMMGVENLQAICAALAAAHLPGDTAVGIVQDAAHHNQKVWTSTVTEIAEAGPPPALRAPAVTVIGDVAQYAGRLIPAAPAH